MTKKIKNEVILNKLDPVTVKQLFELKDRSYTLTPVHQPLSTKLYHTIHSLALEMRISPHTPHIINHIINSFKEGNPILGHYLKYLPFLKTAHVLTTSLHLSLKENFSSQPKFEDDKKEDIDPDTIGITYKTTPKIKKLYDVLYLYTKETPLYHPVHFDVIQTFITDKHPHILIEGEPGTGKTSIANFIGGSKTALFLDLCEVSSLKALCQPTHTRTLYVINDVDKLVQTTEDTKKLLDFLDKKDISVILTTNHPEKLEKAVRRSGRLDYNFKIDSLSSIEDAEAIIYKVCKTSRSDLALHQLCFCPDKKLPREMVDLILKLSKKGGKYSPCKLYVNTMMVLKELNALNLTTFLKLEKEHLKENIKKGNIDIVLKNQKDGNKTFYEFAHNRDYLIIQETPKQKAIKGILALGVEIIDVTIDNLLSIKEGGDGVKEIPLTHRGYGRYMKEEGEEKNDVET